ncbi:type II secretion system protein [bacterium]|nr:type II secretion system protein [bacterium]
MNPKKAFTIIELLFVILIVSFLVPTIFTIYNGIQKQKIEIDVKQKLMFQ